MFHIFGRRTVAGGGARLRGLPRGAYDDVVGSQES